MHLTAPPDVVRAHQVTTAQRDLGYPTRQSGDEGGRAGTHRTLPDHQTPPVVDKAQVVASPAVIAWMGGSPGTVTSEYSAGYPNWGGGTPICPDAL